jgi:hypothetical protein
MNYLETGMPPRQLPKRGRPPGHCPNQAHGSHFELCKFSMRLHSGERYVHADTSRSTAIRASHHGASLVYCSNFGRWNCLAPKDGRSTVNWPLVLVTGLVTGFQSVADRALRKRGSPQSAAFSRVRCPEKPASAKIGFHGRLSNTTAGVGAKARSPTAPPVQPFRTTSTCTCD